MNQDVSASSSRGGFPGPSNRADANQDVSASSSRGGLPDPSNRADAKTDSGPVARSLYTTPIPGLYRSVFYTPPPGWIYWMSWNTIYSGDCRMEGAILHLYPDAMIFFQASTFSSSSGDVWLMKGLQFVDGFGFPVGHPIPQHNGMNMAWEGSEYPLVFWDAIPGVGPAGAAQIRSATMFNHC